MKHKNIISSTIFLCCLSLSSCKKLIEIPPPVGQINSNTVFSSDATANAALIGMYLTMVSTGGTLITTPVIQYPGLSSDELGYSNSAASTEEFRSNAISPSNGPLRFPFWQFPYNLIFQANNVIAGLEKSNAVTPSLRKQLTAEAKLIRGFCYFYLVGIFGDVPLVTTLDYEETRKIPRTPAAKVYEQIIKDLREAKQDLSETYVTTGRVRPNKWTAASLLSRTYLFTQEWAKAEEEATSVIGSGQYSLLTNLNNVFLGANNNEAIWQLLPASTATLNHIGNTFIPGSNTIPTYPLTSWLLSAFEQNDQRKSAWTKTIVVAGNTYYHPYKYKVRTGTPVTEYYMMIRLAELYLIRSEARAQQDKLPGALQDLNVIRTRAGLPSLPPTLSKASILLAIEQERRIELFCEWGDRWLTLQRTGRADAVLGPIKPGWQSTDILYPIPNAEILGNPLLTQNPGY